MRLRHLVSVRLIVAVVAGLVLAVGAVTPAIGQDSVSLKPKPVQVPRGTITGEIVDTADTAIAGAEVVVLTADSVIVVSTTSNAAGRFAITNLSAGAYTVFARRIGYKSVRGHGLKVAAGDTLRLRLVLVRNVVELAPITVRARRSRNRIGADDFNPKHHRDALSVIVQKRSYMLGDPEWCAPPDSFGVPQHERVRLKITDRLLLYTSSMGERLRSISRRPWMDTLRRDPFAEPNLPYVRALYVNGLRADIPGDPIMTPVRLLREIPSQHVAEMRYVDCWDNTMSLGMQYSLYVVLKPLPPAAQDSLYRRILSRAQNVGPVSGKVLSVSKPTKAFIDSLKQFFSQGSDSSGASSAP